MITLNQVLFWMRKYQFPERDCEWLAPYFVSVGNLVASLLYDPGDMPGEMEKVIFTVGARTVFLRNHVPPDEALKDFVWRGLKGATGDEKALKQRIESVPVPSRPRELTVVEIHDYELERLKIKHANHVQMHSTMRLHENKQSAEALAGAAESLNGQFSWMPSGEGNFQQKEGEQNAFAKWLMGDAPEPSGPQAKMNCWEGVFFSAFKAGLMSREALKTLHVKALKGLHGSFYDCLNQALGLDRALPLVPEVFLLPQRGDIVFMEGNTHVAICVQASPIMLMSMWKHPKDGFLLHSIDEFVVFKSGMSFVDCPF